MEKLQIPSGLASKVGKVLGIGYNAARYRLVQGDFDTWQIAFKIIEEDKAKQNHIRERLSQLQSV